MTRPPFQLKKCNLLTGVLTKKSLKIIFHHLCHLCGVLVYLGEEETKPMFDSGHPG